MNDFKDLETKYTSFAKEPTYEELATKMKETLNIPSNKEYTFEEIAQKYDAKLTLDLDKEYPLEKCTEEHFDAEILEYVTQLREQTVLIKQLKDYLKKPEGEGVLESINEESTELSNSVDSNLDIVPDTSFLQENHEAILDTALALLELFKSGGC